MDIRLISDAPNGLEVQLRPDAEWSSADGVASLVFTVKWNTADGGALGAPDQTTWDVPPFCMQQGMATIESSVEVDNGGSRYQTYVVLGSNPLPAGCSFPANQWTRLALLPVSGLSNCVPFEIGNDAYTAANNLNFFFSMAGSDVTGSIVPPGTYTGPGCPVDCLGVPFGPNGPGTPCDDGDPLTYNDQYDLNCGCAGVTCILPDITSVTNSGPLCGVSAATMSVSVSGTPPFTYSWGGPGIISGQDAQDMQAVAPGPGNALYTVQVTNACGSDNGNTTLITEEQPMGGFYYEQVGSPPGVFCTLFPDPGPIPVNLTPGGTYTGSPGLVMNASGVVDLDATGPGGYTVTYTIPAGVACAEYVYQQNISIYAPTTWYNDADGDGAGDPNQSTVACDTQYLPPGNWVLDNSDNCPFDSNKLDPGACGCGAPEPGTSCDDGDATTINDVITSSCACAGTTCLPVIVSTTGGDFCGQFAQDLHVVVSGQGPFTFNWSGPNLVGDVTLPNALAVNTSPGTYNYTVTVTNACGSVQGTASVVFQEQPIYEFSYAQPYPLDQPIVCGNQGFAQVQQVWNGQTGVGGSYSANGISVDPITGAVDLSSVTSNGLYTIFYTVPAGGCPEYTTSASLSVQALKTYYPDADGDGIGTLNGAVTVCNPAELPSFPTWVTTTGDQCPFDANKTEPGLCGCFEPEPGTACDDGDPQTTFDVIGNDCLCGNSCVAIIDSITNSGPTCGGFQQIMNVYVSGTGPFTYAWSGPNLIGDLTLPSVQAINTTSGDRTYTVTVTNACGSVQASTTAHYEEPPQGGFTYDYPSNVTVSWCTTYGQLSPDQIFPLTPGGFYQVTQGQGLVLDPQTGVINSAASQPGSYTVTYTVNVPGCPTFSTSAGVFMGTLTTWYADQDGDGVGDPNTTQQDCYTPGPGAWVTGAGDLCPFDPNKTDPGTCGCFDPEPGALCDDGDANTINDVIGAGCTCDGTTYCTPFSGGGFPSFGHWIDGVLLGAINNPGSGPGPAEQYTYYGTQYTTSLQRGYPDTLSITSASGVPTRFAAWIDLDRDGVFSPAEKLGESSNAFAGEVIHIPFSVPTTTPAGTTVLRVRAVYIFPGDPDPMDPCFIYGYSEVEDYQVDIAPVYDCENVADGPALPGTACDDQDPFTQGDEWNVNCQCIGHPVNDDVCSAIVIGTGVNGPFSNVNATVQTGEPAPPVVGVGSCTDQQSWCDVPSHSVWFQFVAPASGSISLNFGSTATWDSELAIWSAASCTDLLSGGGTLVAANDDIAFISPYQAAITPVCVVPGETYFVQVDGYQNTVDAAFELVLVEEPGIGTACDDGNPATYNDVIGGDCVCAGLPFIVGVDLKVRLEGPYDPTTGLMDDGLRANGLLPLTEPYTAMGYNFIGPPAGTLSPLQLGDNGPLSFVDWVIVELRSLADPGLVVASRAAIVLRNGTVVDALTGQIPMRFEQVLGGDYHVAVRHRNHLGVMSAVAQGMCPICLPVLDLSDPATGVYGIDARKSVSGAFPASCLWSGDVTFDGELKYTGSANDRDPILQSVGGVVPTSTSTGYVREDVNMDGVVRYTGSDNDRDPILQNIGGVVPTNVRQEQLP